MTIVEVYAQDLAGETAFERYVLERVLPLIPASSLTTIGSERRWGSGRQS